MTTQMLTGIQLVMVAQNAPTVNFYSKGYAALRQAATAIDYEIFGKFALPGAKSATYSGTKIRIYNTGAAIPSRTYVLQRLTAAFNPTRLKYANRPAATSSGQVSVTQAVGARGAANDYIEFDITGILNTVSPGTVPWYGFKIVMTSTDSTARAFYNARGSTVKGPRVEATWSTAPKQPTNLRPALDQVISVEFPILSADYIDVSGSTQMSSLQVQIHSVNDFTGAVDFDSGEVASAYPEYDTADGAFAGISAGQTKYWRLRWKDADNEWSVWSAVSSFTRTAKGAVTILSPDVAPDNFVEEVTPPILWSFSGGTQKSFQVLVWNASKTQIKYDSGKITDVDTGISIDPTGALVNGLTYVAEVRIWDDLNRASLPNDPGYVSVERAFVVQTSAIPDPTTDLVVTQVPHTPWAKLQWKRGTDPDLYDFFRNNVLIAGNIEPEEVFVSGDDYEFVDRFAQPNKEHTWEVRPKVNGQTASGNDTATTTIVPTTAYLTTLDGTMSIPFLNYVEDINYADGSTVIDIMNSDEAITVYQSVGGARGTFSGILSGARPGLLGTEVAKDHLDNFLSLREEDMRGKLCVLTFKDQAFVGVLSQMQYSTTVYREEICYLASFYVTAKTRYVA